MQRVPTEEPRLKEAWLCRWCYAWTELGTGPGDVSRPQYQSMNLRWERADAEELPSDVSHAYGCFGTTLCGIQQDSMSPSPYPWMPGWEDACQACKEAAVVIDQRWPLEMRGWNRAQGTPPFGSNWPPF